MISSHKAGLKYLRQCCAVFCALCLALILTPYHWLGFALSIVAIVCIGMLLLKAIKAIRMMQQQFDQLDLNSQGQSKQLMGLRLQLGDVVALLRDQKDEFTKAIQTIEEVEAVLSEVGKGTDQTLKQSQEAKASADEGLQQISSVLRAMEQIEGSNSQLKVLETIISDVADKTSVIDSIAFKTQLLSFNAAIEAALAGDKGHGFSVVASEFGTLADNSSRAAAFINNLLDKSRNQTSEMIESIGSKIRIGKETTDKCVVSFTSIHQNVSDVTSMVAIIKNTSEQQKAGLADARQIFNELQKLNLQALKSYSNVVGILPNDSPDEFALTPDSDSDQLKAVG